VFCSECRKNFHPGCVGLKEVPNNWRCEACVVEDTELPPPSPVPPLEEKVEKVLDWRFEAAEEDAAAQDAGGQEDQRAKGAAALAAVLAQVSAAATAPETAGDSGRQVRLREMFVKWRGRAYIHCAWVQEKQLVEYHPGLLRHFLKREGLAAWGKDGAGMVAEEEEEGALEEEEEGIDMDQEYINGIRPQWLQAQRVIASRTKYGVEELLVKWTGLPYNECTWESEEGKRQPHIRARTHSHVPPAFACGSAWLLAPHQALTLTI